MLDKELEQTLNAAFKAARDKRHEFMTVEHLLLALIDNPAALSVLTACGVNFDVLSKELEEFVDSTTPLIPEDNEEQEVQPTLGFQRVLHCAACECNPQSQLVLTYWAGLQCAQRRAAGSLREATTASLPAAIESCRLPKRWAV